MAPNMQVASAEMSTSVSSMSASPLPPPPPPLPPSDFAPKKSSSLSTLVGGSTKPREVPKSPLINDGFNSVIDEIKNATLKRSNKSKQHVFKSQVNIELAEQGGTTINASPLNLKPPSSGTIKGNNKFENNVKLNPATLRRDGIEPIKRSISIPKQQSGNVTQQYFNRANLKPKAKQTVNSNHDSNNTDYIIASIKRSLSVPKQQTESKLEPPGSTRSPAFNSVRNKFESTDSSSAIKPATKHVVNTKLESVGSTRSPVFNSVSNKFESTDTSSEIKPVTRHVVNTVEVLPPRLVYAHSLTDDSSERSSSADLGEEYCDLSASSGTPSPTPPAATEKPALMQKPDADFYKLKRPSEFLVRTSAPPLLAPLPVNGTAAKTNQPSMSDDESAAATKLQRRQSTNSVEANQCSTQPERELSRSGSVRDRRKVFESSKNEMPSPKTVSNGHSVVDGTASIAPRHHRVVTPAAAGLPPSGSGSGFALSNPDAKVSTRLQVDLTQDQATLQRQVKSLGNRAFANMLSAYHKNANEMVLGQGHSMVVQDHGNARQIEQINKSGNLNLTGRALPKTDDD